MGLRIRRKWKCNYRRAAISVMIGGPAGALSGYLKNKAKSLGTQAAKTMYSQSLKKSLLELKSKRTEYSDNQWKKMDNN